MDEVFTTETKVERTPLNGPLGILVFLPDNFKRGDEVIVTISKKQLTEL